MNKEVELVRGLLHEKAKGLNIYGSLPGTPNAQLYFWRK
jgi:hypothetical protein